MWRIALLIPLLLTMVSGTLAGTSSLDPARPAKATAAHHEPFMRVYGTALPPFGFVEFCQRMPSECIAGAASDARVAATPARLSEMDDINRRTNRQITPVTDLELYGVNEYWTMPTVAGDCEDYVLLKRHRLIERGWPASALLITVVRDEQGEGHAVLTVRTAQGDFILDNKTPEIRLWSETGYRFVMRQSFMDPRLWMSLDQGGSSLAPLTGNRR